jgi:carbonic anhydrase
VLWIGDSRVPETTVCNCKPGEIFVHRNIANCVHADDISSASVVEYAVTHLKVKKVVVCGHTQCGGANAALGDTDLGQTLNTWLHPVREYVYTNPWLQVTTHVVEEVEAKHPAQTTTQAQGRARQTTRRRCEIPSRR